MRSWEVVRKKSRESRKRPFRKSLTRRKGWWRTIRKSRLRAKREESFSSKTCLRSWKSQSKRWSRKEKFLKLRWNRFLRTRLERGINWRRRSCILTLISNLSITRSWMKEVNRFHQLLSQSLTASRSCKSIERLWKRRRKESTISRNNMLRITLSSTKPKSCWIKSKKRSIGLKNKRTREETQAVQDLSFQVPLKLWEMFVVTDL